MTDALIISAGNASASGLFDPIQKIGGVSAVQRQILVFQQAGIERVAVVTGRDARDLEKHISHMGVVCLRNEKHQSTEMLNSVQLGLEYLKDKNPSVLIAPVNVPFFTVETVRHLINADAPLVIPVYRQKKGHPILLSRELFPFILKYAGGNGLSGAVQVSNAPILYIDVPDEGILVNLKKNDAVEGVAERHNMSKLRPGVKLSLAREQVFFGPGPMQLLKLVDETKSLRLACRQMGISYSKSLKIIANMEQQLGYEIVSSRQGGKDGGQSVITPEGKELMQKYMAFSEECMTMVQDIFDKHFRAYPL